MEQMLEEAERERAQARTAELRSMLGRG